MRIAPVVILGRQDGANPVPPFEHPRPRRACSRGRVWVVEPTTVDHTMLGAAPVPSNEVRVSRRPMRIMMLSWEYPPLVVGGLGRHVHALATSLVTAGHDVTVVTRHALGAPLEEYLEGVRI